MPSGFRNSLAPLLTAAAIAFAPADAVAQDPQLPAVDTAQRSVGVMRSGDALRIVVYREKDLTGEFLIDSRGQLQMPGVGVIQAAGLDPQQLKSRIREALLQRGFTNPDISVQPLIRVSVLGEVRAPALYPVDPGTSLIQLLTIAGGPTPAANLRQTRVVREGRVFEVDLQSALVGSAAGRVVLYSNDVVVVPKRTGFTRENVSFVLNLATSALALATFVITVQNNNRRP
ncbi:MAG TPA: polysaccharide biosynthesis/export family protein [Gemmatimonadaceae bacterium]|nr:polysaccharide biosynthesis/export family protein [Gemmatimonadaceae bacterium]